MVQDMAAAARAAGVRIVTGDTKVVERGKGEDVYKRQPEMRFKGSLTLPSPGYDVG